MRIAFYKGKGLIGNAVIRSWTRSPYSHCELVFDVPSSPTGTVWASSSLMDGGVRTKNLRHDPLNWDIAELPWADSEAAWQHLVRTHSDSYSWVDLIRTQMFNRPFDEKGASFCSEWCAAALGLPEPAMYSPGSLAKLVTYLNQFKADPT